MPNNCLSVLYKHIIRVENKNVGLKVGGGVIRKESSDSSHECIILDVIHHVLIKNICTCAV